MFGDRTAVRAARLRSAVTPHERRIFELLEAQAVIAAETLGLLEELVHHWPDHQALAAELAAQRHAADGAREAAFSAVHRTFVTALEREDIVAVSDALADAARHAEAGANLVAAYGLGRAPEPARRLTQLLRAAGRELRTGVGGLRRIDAVAAPVDEVRRLEAEGERLLRDGRSDLFAGEVAVRELLAWKDVYDALGSTLGACAAAGRALHAMELKGR